jgi:hypothetical protein
MSNTSTGFYQKNNGDSNDTFTTKNSDAMRLNSAILSPVISNKVGATTRPR